MVALAPTLAPNMRELIGAIPGEQRFRYAAKPSTILSKISSANELTQNEELCILWNTIKG